MYTYPYRCFESIHKHQMLILLKAAFTPLWKCVPMCAYVAVKRLFSPSELSYSTFHLLLNDVSHIHPSPHGATPGKWSEQLETLIPLCSCHLEACSGCNCTIKVLLLGMAHPVCSGFFCSTISCSPVPLCTSRTQTYRNDLVPWSSYTNFLSLSLDKIVLAARTPLTFSSFSSKWI